MLISSAADLKASRGYGGHNVPFALPAAGSGLCDQRCCSRLWQGSIYARAGKTFDAETGYGANYTYQSEKASTASASCVSNAASCVSYAAIMADPHSLLLFLFFLKQMRSLSAWALAHNLSRR